MSVAMPLPTALQAWQPWLNWFTPDLAAALGDLLLRMHPLLGRFQGRRQGGVAEPDGVEDLRRRGSYERLLSSEWLLATELPDEFLRRAAGGEHLFLAPRPVARQADKLIVAVFDAGPWQLGAPRLAHMALWILLARRALEVGGALRWGVLQEPGVWYEADAAEDLKRLLRARSFDVASDLHWPQWAQWLDAHAAGLGESWLLAHTVDAARSQPLPPSHTVQVRPGLAGGALDIALRAGAVARAMELPLPPEQPAAQLLRGQFRVEATPQAHEQRSDRLSLKFAPVIAPSGNLVAVPLLDGGGAMVFRVPPPGERKRGKHKQHRWGAGAVLLGAAFCSKSFTAMLHQGQQLQFWQNAALGAQDRPPLEAFDAAPGRGALVPAIWQRDANHSRMFVQDWAGRLVFWVGSHLQRGVRTQPRGPMTLDHGVLAIAPVDDKRLVYVCADKGQLKVRYAGAGGREALVHDIHSGAACTKVLLLGGPRWNKGFAVCAIRTSVADQPEVWLLQQGTAVAGQPPMHWHIQLAPGASAIGLVHLAMSDQYALVVQAANRLDLSLHGPDGAEPLLTLTSLIVRASLCPVTGLAAILTEDRALHVFAVADKAMRLVVHSGVVEPQFKIALR